MHARYLAHCISPWTRMQTKYTHNAYWSKIYISQWLSYVHNVPYMIYGWVGWKEEYRYRICMTTIREIECSDSHAFVLFLFPCEREREPHIHKHKTVVSLADPFKKCSLINFFIIFGFSFYFLFVVFFSGCKNSYIPLFVPTTSIL